MAADITHPSVFVHDPDAPDADQKRSAPEAPWCVSRPHARDLRCGWPSWRLPFFRSQSFDRAASVLFPPKIQEFGVRLEALAAKPASPARADRSIVGTRTAALVEKRIAIAGGRASADRGKALLKRAVAAVARKGTRAPRIAIFRRGVILRIGARAEQKGNRNEGKPHGLFSLSGTAFRPREVRARS
jgi:hypothetical protein